MKWFEQLFGLPEISDPFDFSYSFRVLKNNFVYDPNGIWGPELKSQANGRIFYPGKFSLKNIVELKQDIERLESHPERSEFLESKRNQNQSNKSTITHVAMADVFEEHCKYPDAMFMAASQLNCLEFASPDAVPERGISIYEFDRTQGPACALACAPATFYRNYLVPVFLENNKINRNDAAVSHFQLGQTERHQINLLEDTETILASFSARAFLNNKNKNKKENEKEKKIEGFWEIRNGYLDSTPESLRQLKKLLISDSHLYLQIKESIKIGLLTDTQVVFASRRTTPWTLIDDNRQPKIFVDQAYCSAIACGYSKHVFGENVKLWETFAVLMLAAQYEAVLLAAYRNHLLRGTFERKRPKVFLTILGGGVFNNKMEWIAKAICEAFTNTSDLGLDIAICHYLKVDETFVSLLDETFILQSVI